MPCLFRTAIHSHSLRLTGELRLRLSVMIWKVRALAQVNFVALYRSKLQATSKPEEAIEMVGGPVCHVLSSFSSMHPKRGETIVIDALRLDPLNWMDPYGPVEQDTLPSQLWGRYIPNVLYH